MKSFLKKLEVITAANPIDEIAVQFYKSLKKMGGEVKDVNLLHKLAAKMVQDLKKAKAIEKSEKKNIDNLKISFDKLAKIQQSLKAPRNPKEAVELALKMLNKEGYTVVNPDAVNEYFTNNFNAGPKDFVKHLNPKELGEVYIKSLLRMDAIKPK